MNEQEIIIEKLLALVIWVAVGVLFSGWIFGGGV